MKTLPWIVERRLISDSLEPHSWLAIACTNTLEEAESRYRLRLLHLAGHEMRLLDPTGRVLIYSRDPAAARPGAFALLYQDVQDVAA